MTIAKSCVLLLSLWTILIHATGAIRAQDRMATASLLMEGYARECLRNDPKYRTFNEVRLLLHSYQPPLPHEGQPFHPFEISQAKRQLILEMSKRSLIHMIDLRDYSLALDVIYDISRNEGRETARYLDKHGAHLMIWMEGSRQRGEEQSILIKLHNPRTVCSKSLEVRIRLIPASAGAVEEWQADEARRKAAEEAKRIAAETEARRKAEKAAEAAVAEARRKAEDEAKRVAAEAEARRKAEEAAKAAAAEAQRKAEEQARRVAAEGEARRKAEQASKAAEIEGKRKVGGAPPHEAGQALVSYDGSWTVYWKCGRGCNPSRCSDDSYTLSIQSGRISGGRRSGTISDSGRARWSWTHSQGYGRVTARAVINGRSGSGSWSNESGCSGSLTIRHN